MAHIDLEHFEMKPGPVVKFEITQHRQHAKTMLVAGIVASVAIICVAMLFLSMRV